MSDASIQPSSSSAVPEDAEYRDLARKIIQSNKTHQAALTDYIKRLTTEWNNLDVLINAAEAIEYDSESDNEAPEVVIPGAQRAIGPISLRGLLRNDDSPLHLDALRLDTYNRLTTVQLMKKREIDVLSEAVRTENTRINAFQAQKRKKYGEPPIEPADIDRNTEGLDWERICQKVTDSCQVIPRTPRDYEIRWIGDLHPDVRRGEWSGEEKTALMKLVEEYEDGSTSDWVKIAKTLGTNRPPIDVMSQATGRAPHRWDDERERRLVEAVQMYGEDNFMLVARHVSEETTAKQASQHYYRNLKEELKRKPWTTQDDQRLLDVVEMIGTHDWLAVANFMHERTNDQCRERWESLERSRTKDLKWTTEEDIQLWNLVDELGNKWREISKRMESKTADKCRTRYTTLKDNGFDPSRGIMIHPKTRKRGHNDPRLGQDVFSLPEGVDSPQAEANIESSTFSMPIDIGPSTLSQPQTQERVGKVRGKSKMTKPKKKRTTVEQMPEAEEAAELPRRSARPKPRKRGPAPGNPGTSSAAPPTASS